MVGTIPNTADAPFRNKATVRKIQRKCTINNFHIHMPRLVNSRENIQN